MQVALYHSKDNSVSTKEVPSVFAIDKINHHLIWEVITAENANRRQGTHNTKTRGEVRGGGKKPWRQKGTGRARAGSIRSPIWVGGGVAFGPKPRNYRQSISQKKKKAGYRNIIAQKVKTEKVILLDDLKFSKISTKDAFKQMDQILKKAPFYEEYIQNRKLRPLTNKNRRMITVVTSENDINVKKSLRNIPWLNLIHSERLAARSVFYNHGLVFTEKAFEHAAKYVSG